MTTRYVKKLSLAVLFVIVLGVGLAAVLMYVLLGGVLESNPAPQHYSKHFERINGRNQHSPEFFVWAAHDPLDAPLQRIQMVKGWIDEQGKTHEKVVDIACADGLQVEPVSGRCPDNGASVDLNTCQFSGGSGATELKTLWRDPDYDPNQDAFYYVRVLMNPTCRWSTFDAIRLGREPDPSVPATLQERAWSSPIWSDA